MIEAQIDDLLRELCVDLGFCFQGDSTDRFYDDTPTHPASFARAVFEADGVDFDSESSHGLKQAVQARVAKYMMTTETRP